MKKRDDAPASAQPYDAKTFAKQHRIEIAMVWGNNMALRSAVIMLGLAVTAAVSAHAEESTNLQLHLGALLAAEDECYMRYDKDAIERFIERNVSADDLDFAASLPLMVKGQLAQIEQMSGTSKLAFCTQQRRAAKKLGFVQ